jgi:hypothetical protein
MDTYILYKNPIQTDTLAIVQYLHSNGINIIPTHCIERNHPIWAVELPSIETTDGKKYVGLNQCIEFYQHATGKNNILKEALVFKQYNPDYKICK